MKKIFLFTLVCAATLLAGCGTTMKSSAAESAKPLAGTEWTLVEMGGQAVAVTEGLRTPTLQLDTATKRATGTSGINRFFGSYESSGATLKFGPLAGTKMAGPPAAMSVEQAFHKALAGVSSWSVTSNRLELKADGKTILRFQSR